MPLMPDDTTFSDDTFDGNVMPFPLIFSLRMDDEGNFIDEPDDLYITEGDGTYSSFIYDINKENLVDKGEGFQVNALDLEDSVDQASVLFFSLRSNSLAQDGSVTSQKDGSHIYVSRLDGTNSIFVSATDIGLDESDDIDALIFFGDDDEAFEQGEYFLFSVSFRLATTGLDPGAIYIYRYGDSKYSLFASSTVLGTEGKDIDAMDAINPFSDAPDTPSNISPSNGETNVLLTPTLTSSDFSDPDTGDTHTATQWQITDTSGDYSDPVFDSLFPVDNSSENLTSITIPQGKLGQLTTYYWRVRHKDGNHWSSFSEETSFTTLTVPNDAPDTPSNVSPADGESDVSLTPMLTSSAFSDSDAEDIHIASQWEITDTKGDYSVPVLNSGEDSLNLTSLTVPSGTLMNAVTYFWKVRYKDDKGAWSQYSSETSFTTLDNSSPNTSSGSTNKGNTDNGGGNGGNCFITTITRNSPMEKDIHTLSQFRDSYLATHESGRILVAYYYRIGSTLAEMINQNEMLKAFVRITLRPFIWISRQLVDNGVSGHMTDTDSPSIKCTCAQKKHIGQ